MSYHHQLASIAQRLGDPALADTLRVSDRGHCYIRPLMSRDRASAIRHRQQTFSENFSKILQDPSAMSALSHMTTGQMTGVIAAALNQPLKL